MTPRLVAFALSILNLVASSAAQSIEGLGALPSVFVPNVGQEAVGVLFEARGPLGGVLCGQDVLAIELPTDAGSERVVLEFGVAHPGRAAPVGEAPSTGRFHFLRGRDAAAWRRNVQGFGRLRYAQVAPGVDLVVEGVGTRLKLTWHVAPGVRTSSVRWRWSAAQPAIVGAGIEVATASGARLREASPVAWVETTVAPVEGVRRRDVACRYVLRDDGWIGIEVEGRADDEALVVDPEIAWASFLGGNGSELILGLDADDRGALYVTGYVHSRHVGEPFPLHAPGGAPPLQSCYGGEIGDAFVTKIRHDVTPPEIVYSTRLGGGRNVEGAQELHFGDPLPALSVGEVQLGPAGIAWSPGFGSRVTLPSLVWFPPFGAVPPLFYPYPMPHPKDPSKSVPLRPTGTDRGFALAVDRRNGEVVVVGRTQADDFPGTGSASLANLARVPARFPAHQPLIGSPNVERPEPEDFADTHDAFIARLSADGAELVFGTYFGGPLEEDARGVAIDRAGNAYVVGHLKSTAGSAPDLTAYGGLLGKTSGIAERHDGFVLCFDPQGRLVAGTYLGGDEEDFVTGVAVGKDPRDPDQDRVVVTGTTRSPELLAKLAPERALSTVLQADYAGATGPAVEPYLNFGLGDVYWYADGFVLELTPDLSRCLQGTFVDGGALCRVLEKDPSKCPPGPINEWMEKVALGDAGEVFLLGRLGPAPVSASFVVRMITEPSGRLWPTGITALAGEYRVHAYDLSVGRGQVWICGFVQHDPVLGGQLPVLSPLRGRFIADHVCDNGELRPKDFDLGRFQTAPPGGTCVTLTDGFVAAYDARSLAPLFVSYVGGEGNEFLQGVRVVADGVVLGGIAGRPCSKAPRLNAIRQGGLWNASEIDPQGRYGATGVYQGSRYPCAGHSDGYLLKIR